MTTETEPSTTPFEETINNMRKATESALDSQRELYDKWAKMWPGMIASSDWTSQKHKFKQDWTALSTELLHRHRELVDQKYRAGIESLEEALRVSEAENPEDFRDRLESLCRKTLDLMKSTSETQMNQFQEAVSKWIDVCQMKP